MATSSKVKFSLETLREKALASIDFRIAKAELEAASYDDDEALSARVAAWRASTEERISDLFRRLGDDGISDYELSKWKIAPIPSVDVYDRQDAVRTLERLKSKRTQIEAKSASIVPDADGNVSLTKTQLEEFFGL